MRPAASGHVATFNDPLTECQHCHKRFRVDHMQEAVAEIGGVAVVVHAGADNFANIPTRYAPAPDEQTLMTGDAGSRIACGVIEVHAEQADESGGSESGSHGS